MYRRPYRKAAPVIALALLAAGCVQATRHSNTMIFGTNTTVGFKVGQNVNQVPEIMLAYDRQEAVIMPLVANTATANGSRLLEPCDFAKTLPLNSDVPFRSHPCSLVAWNGESQDSYSVLASFGADFGGQVEATNTNAKAGLAQYFATGLAAQILALKGGAALVSTGAAAQASAATSDSASLTALLTNAADAPAVQADIDATKNFSQRLIDKIRATATGDLVARLKLFEQRAAVAQVGLHQSCTGRTPDQCADFVADRNNYTLQYPARKQAFEDALNDWDKPEG